MNTAEELGRSLFGFGLAGDDLAIHHMILRAFIVYMTTILMIRLGKRHFMSRDSGMDLIVGVVLGAIVSRAIVGSSPFLPALAAGAALVVAHWALSLAAYRWPALESLLKGEPRVLVEDGRIHEDRLAQAHMTTEDLWQGFRDKGVDRAEQVARATLERNGQVSVLKTPTTVMVPAFQTPEGPRTLKIEIHL